MKHLEFLNILCKYRKIINEAYLNKKTLLVNEELVEIGLFYKIGNYYYLNDSYKKFVDTILQRGDFEYIIEDFNKEIERLLFLKEEFFNNKTLFILEKIEKLILKIFNNMENRDKQINSLLISLEKDNKNELDFLIKEAKRVLSDIEIAMENSMKFINILEELKEIKELNRLIKNIIFDVVNLNDNIDSYLKRLRDFISQTEKKRAFNQKLQKISLMIINEDRKIDNFILSKDKIFNSKIEVVADIIDSNKVKKIFNINITNTNQKKISGKIKKEVVNIIDVNQVIRNIKGSNDIFSDIIKNIGENLSEAMRIFVYVLNNFDNEIYYTDNFNKYNVRVVKWK